MVWYFIKELWDWFREQTQKKRVPRTQGQKPISDIELALWSNLNGDD